MTASYLRALIACAIAFCVVGAWAADLSGLDETQGKRRMQQIRALIGSDGLAKMRDSNFGVLALGHHRPYHLFVIFNARAPHHNCAMCGAFEDELSVLATSYQRMQDPGGDLPVFFAKAEYQLNVNTFQNYGFKNVPILVYYEPTAESSNSDSSIGGGNKYTGSLDAEGAAGFVEGYTGAKIEIYRSPVRMIITLLVLSTIVLFVIRFWGSQLIELALGLRNHKSFWFLLSMAVYMISISGVLYDIIRGTPPFGMDRQGKVTWVHPSSRDQFAVEGLMIGAMNIGCALAVVFLCVYAKRMGGETNRAIAAMSGLVAFVIVYMQIVGLYRRKSPWYMRF